jgi:hypothetical protein
MDSRDRRLAENEAFFREVNERIESLATDHLGRDAAYDFLCECANPDCTFRIRLPLSVYEKVRADSKQFIVLPLHYTPEIEDLAIREETYWVVRKTGEAGDHVDDLDPRDRQ